MPHQSYVEVMVNNFINICTHELTFLHFHYLYPAVNAIRGLSLLLVLSLAPTGFSPGTPAIPSAQKPTFPNSNSTRNQVDEETLCGYATSKSLFYFIYLLLINSLVQRSCCQAEIVF